MEDIRFIFANTKDEGSINNFLLEVGLPYQDISGHLGHFLLAKSNDTLIGVVGLEVHGEFGLLRSLAVALPYRGRGIGMVLCERILAYAHLQGIKELYLFTMTAENFFTKLGFIKIDRENIPKEIQGTEEFQTLCPSTAICMFKRIEKVV